MRRALAIAVLLTSAAARAQAPAEMGPAIPEVTVAEPESRGLAGPWRISGNLGYPEIMGLGVGRTFGDGGWRVQFDFGTIVLVSTFTLHAQRLIYRWRYVATAVGVHGGMFWDPDLIGEYPQPDSSAYAGARGVLELGDTRGIGFDLEGGVTWWANPSAISRDAKMFVPSLALRLHIAW